MKKNLLQKHLILLILLSFSFKIKAQNTTKTEYLYMTKGIKVQIDSGLDIKKGYKLRSLAKITEGSYKFTYLVLQREQTSKNFNLGKYAGIVIIADSEESGRRYYRAIPFQLLDWDNKDPLTNLFRNDVQEWDKYMSQAFAISSTRVLASLMNVYGKVLYENNVN